MGCLKLTYKENISSKNLRVAYKSGRKKPVNKLIHNGKKTKGDYLVFGMPMPGRYLPGNMVGMGGYRYGFQGQEKADEISGSTGTHYAYKYRMYDARIGKFFSIDPLTASYPHNSPYAFGENRVIGVW